MRRHSPKLTTLLTRREVAELLHVSESTLVRLNRSGAIPIMKVSKRAVRIDPADVDAYQASQRMAAAAGPGAAA